MTEALLIWASGTTNTLPIIGTRANHHISQKAGAILHKMELSTLLAVLLLCIGQSSH